MVRDVEKLVKIDCPKKISESKLETVTTFPKIPVIDLMNIESHTEPGISIKVDLALDQIEEQE
jgi:hypothetical protein